MASRSKRTKNIRRNKRKANKTNLKEDMKRLQTNMEKLAQLAEKEQA